MKNKTFHRYNDRLSPDERFRLALAALGREDEAEVILLHRTCPTAAYTMPDHAFSGQWRASSDAATNFALMWYAVHLRLIEAQWMRASRADAARRGLTDATEDEITAVLIERCRELCGVHAGLLLFCERARLDWRALLAWWPPVIEEIAKMRAVLDGEMDEGIADIAEGVCRSLTACLPAFTDDVSGNIGKGEQP